MFEKIKQYLVALVSLALLAVSGLFVSNDRLGYSVATGYESTVRSSMSTSQTFIRVSSLALKDGETLDMTKLGPRVFLTIEPGKAKEEIVMCTTINTSTVSFENCTRGLAFSGTSTVSVSNNQKTHNAGARIVLSNVHYVYEQLTDIDTDQTVDGLWTFTQFPVFNTSTQIPSQDGEFATKYYVDQVGAGGFTAANVSTTRGLSVDGSAPERVGINASSTTGMAFDAQGRLYQAISSTLGWSDNLLGVSENGFKAAFGSLTGVSGKIPFASSTGSLDPTWLGSSPYSWSVPTVNASGSSQFVGGTYLLSYVTSSIAVNTGTLFTIFSTTVPGGMLANNGVLVGDIDMSIAGSSGGIDWLVYVNGTSTALLNIPGSDSCTAYGKVSVKIAAITTSTNFISIVQSAECNDSTSGGYSGVSTTSTSINFGVDTPVTIYGRRSAVGTSANVYGGSLVLYRR